MLPSALVRQTRSASFSGRRAKAGGSTLSSSRNDSCPASSPARSGGRPFPISSVCRNRQPSPTDQPRVFVPQARDLWPERPRPGRARALGRALRQACSLFERTPIPPSRPPVVIALHAHLSLRLALAWITRSCLPSHAGCIRDGCKGQQRRGSLWRACERESSQHPVRGLGSRSAALNPVLRVAPERRKARRPFYSRRWCS
jgi:hypothetical protein